MRVTTQSGARMREDHKATEAALKDELVNLKNKLLKASSVKKHNLAVVKSEEPVWEQTEYEAEVMPEGEERNRNAASSRYCLHERT